MGKKRSVNTHFWSDNYVIDLDPIEKLLFLYLLTNTETNMLGIYEIHIRRIAFDTGIDKEMIKKIFNRFEEANKAKYTGGHVILKNFTDHQSYNTNMKKSALTHWEELPEKIKQDEFCRKIGKALKGFVKGSEGLQSLCKIELEIEKESKEELESEINGQESNPTPSQSEKKEKPSAKERTKKYTPLAKYLAKIVRSHIDYKIDASRIKSWARDLRLLHEQNGVHPKRQKQVLQWYKKNIGGDYIPEAYSGSSFRDKFPKLEAAIKRQKNPPSNGKAKPSGGYSRKDGHKYPTNEVDLENS